MSVKVVRRLLERRGFTSLQMRLERRRVLENRARFTITNRVAPLVKRNAATQVGAERKSNSIARTDTVNVIYYNIIAGKYNDEKFFICERKMTLLD